MPVPPFQDTMNPLLSYAKDGAEHSIQDATEAVIEAMKVTKEQREEMLPSGTQSIIVNRIRWARSYMCKAGLLEATRRGFFKITKRGLEALKAGVRVDVKYLNQFPEFVAFHKSSKENEDDESAGNGKILATKNLTPEELLEETYLEMRRGLRIEILEKIKSCSPQFFERLVIELLVKMGYGGSWRDAAKAVGGSGDGGIDGVINEDRLGLDVVYIQAKRWGASVGRPEIQKFVGALHGKRARKGIFLTTSEFTNEAVEYAQIVESRLVLINGEQLADYMIDFNLGVSLRTRYELKKIDTDFFIDE